MLGRRAGRRRSATGGARPTGARSKDRLTTGGLVARSQGVPGWAWQGIDIDELPRHLTEMAAAEYIAVRSMFIWLASADALSPLQDDIRDA